MSLNLQYIDDGERKSGKVQQLLSDNTNKPTVLVIDDNNDIRQYEHTLLQDDYMVLEAADGKAEVWMLPRRKFPTW